MAGHRLGSIRKILRTGPEVDHDDEKWTTDRGCAQEDGVEFVNRTSHRRQDRRRHERPGAQQVA